jgi:lipoprotein signal peptidase
MRTKQRSTKGLVIFSSIILSIIGILGIINFSINHTLSWSLYPIGALLMIWATFSPTDLPRYRLLGSLIGFSFSIFPFLYLIATLSGDGRWFWPLAVPLALSFIVVLGIFFFLLFLQLKNKWYTVASAFFLFGVVLNYIVGEIIQRYLDNHNIQGEIYNRATVYSFLLASFLFALIGYNKRSK